MPRLGPAARLAVTSLCVLAAASLAHGSAERPAAAAPVVQAQAPPNQPAGDAFAERVTLAERTIVYIEGAAPYDDAFEILADAFRSLWAAIEREGIKPLGSPMAIIVGPAANGFQFQAAVAIAADPKKPLGSNVVVGKLAAGKALKFVHRGSYAAIEETYQGIEKYIDDKKVDTDDVLIEEYVDDLRTSAKENLVVNILVGLK